MRHMLAVLFFLLSALLPTRADAFSWEWVCGDPRSPSPLGSAQNAQIWLSTRRGFDDLTVVTGSNQAAHGVLTRVRQEGLAVVLLKKGNLASWDGGRTWVPVQIDLILFGQNARQTYREAVFLNWQNREQVVGYFPTNATGWIPVLCDDCGNFIRVLRPPLPTTTGGALPPPVMIIPPPPVILIPPTPVTPPMGYTPPGRPEYIQSQAVLGTMSLVRLQPINVTNINAPVANGGSGGSVGPITNTNTNVNQNLNQTVIPIGIGVGAGQ